MQEPSNGDFVAYIDALQRESAARLAQQHVDVVKAGFPSKAGASVFGDKAGSPAGAQPAGGTFVRRDQDAKLLKAVVAAVIGGAFLISWLGSSSPFSVIVGLGLLAYAVPRLVAVYRDRSRRPDSQTAIDHVFGRTGTPTTGTGR